MYFDFVNWGALNGLPNQNYGYGQIAADNGVVIAGTYGFTGGTASLRRSVDPVVSAPAVWASVGPSNADGPVGTYNVRSQCVLADPHNLGVFHIWTTYLVTENGSTVTYVKPYVSTDAGLTWSEHSSGLPDYFGSNASILGTYWDVGKSDGTVYVPVAYSSSGSDYVGIIKCNGSGAWSSTNFSLPSISNSRIYSICVDPNDSNIVYAGHTNVSTMVCSIFKTTDGGATWSEINVSSGPIGYVYIRGIAVDPDDSDHVSMATTYGVSQPTKTWDSTDGGNTWTNTGSFSSSYELALEYIKFDNAKALLLMMPSEVLSYTNSSWNSVAYLGWNNPTYSSMCIDDKVSPQYVYFSGHNAYTPTYSARVVRADVLCTVTGTVYDEDGITPMPPWAAVSYYPADPLRGQTNIGVDSVTGAYTANIRYGLSTCLYLVSRSVPDLPYFSDTIHSFNNIAADYSNMDFVGTLVRAGNDFTSCNPGITNLVGTPSGGSWSGTGITSPTGSFDASIAGMGVHTVTYTIDQDVCGLTQSSYSTVNITVPQPAQVAISPSSGFFCANTPAVLTANASFMAAPIVYTWYEEVAGSGNWNVVGSNTDSITRGYAAGSEYSYYVSAVDANDCVVESAPITVYWSDLSVTGQITIGGTVIYSDIYYCVRGMFLTATAGYYAYQWYLTDLCGVNTLVGTDQTYYASQSGTYNLIAYGTNGVGSCEKTVQVVVFDTPCYILPCGQDISIDLDTTRTAETGLTGLSVTINASATSGTAPWTAQFSPNITGGSGQFTYLWTVQDYYDTCTPEGVPSHAVTYQYTSRCISHTFGCADAGHQFVNLQVTDVMTGSVVEPEFGPTYINTAGPDCNPCGGGPG